MPELSGAEALLLEILGLPFLSFVLSTDETAVASRLQDGTALSAKQAAAVAELVRFLGTLPRSDHHVDANGQLAVFTLSFTDKGTTDLAVSPDGAYLYADTGANGIVDPFAINSAGTLTALSPVVVPGGANLEGIVAI